MTRWCRRLPLSVALGYNLDLGTIAPVWTWEKVLWLDLSYNKLRRLPPRISLPVLERLVITHSQLLELPTRLFLPKLEYLDLSNNQLVTIPELSPTDLPALKDLNLSHNLLRDVTSVMVRLCGSVHPLKSIELKGNARLLAPPYQLIERGGKDVCQYFMDLSRGNMKCWSQTVLVVGQEDAGKTALCRALQGHQCPDHEQITEASTVGIDTVHWQAVVAFEINRLVGGSSLNVTGW